MGSYYCSNPVTTLVNDFSATINAHSTNDSTISLLTCSWRRPSISIDQSRASSLCQRSILICCIQEYVWNPEVRAAPRAFRGEKYAPRPQPFTGQYCSFRKVTFNLPGSCPRSRSSRQHLQVLEPVPMQVFFDCDENKCCERQEPLHPFHSHLFWTQRALAPA